MRPDASVTMNTSRTWLLFGLCSFAAVQTGCWAAAAQGVAVQPLVLNGVAWTLGAALAVGATRVGARWTPVLLALAMALLLLSLFSAGLSEVHRWFAIGPLRMNAAELVLPVALTACAGLERSSLLRLLFPVGSVLISALQPDASQAVAAAAASLVVLLTSTRSVLVRVPAGLVIAAAVAVSLFRPDPLAPVAQVEGIVLLAMRISPVCAVLGVLGVAGSVVSPLLLARAPHPPLRDAVLTLTGYAALSAAAPAFGAFPVPLMGVAVSPIIGAWLGVGGLMRVAAEADGAA